MLNATPNLVTLLRCFRRRMVLAVTLGTVLGAVAAVGAWFFAPAPKHQVRTLLRVPPPSHYVVRTGDRAPDAGSHQRTQVAMAKSRLVLNSALRDPAVANLSLVVNKIEPVEWLEKEVQADFSVAPEIMRISMNGTQTDELVVLVNAIRTAYLSEVVEKERGASRERMNFLGEQLEKYEGRLRVARATQKEIEEQVGGTNAAVLGQALGFLQKTLTATETDLLASQKELRQARLELETLKAREQGVANLKVSEKDLDAALEKDAGISAARLEIEHKKALITGFVDRHPLGERAPEVVRDRRRISSLNKKIEGIKAERKPEIVKRLRETASREVQANVLAQQARIANLEKSGEFLVSEHKRLTARVAEMGQKGAKLDTFREDVSHIENLVKRFRAEHEALKIEMQAPDRVTVLEEGTVARVNVEARKWMMTGAAGLGAFCFALFGISWLEFRARRVDTIDEVVLGLGMRLIGTVPSTRNVRRYGTQGPGAAAAQQVLTESVDAARTMLMHLARTRGLRTVMVTSAVPGEGKTSLSCHLAASLARSGKRTLLIDADIRNPTVHRLFGLENSPGFSEVLSDRAELGASVQPTSLTNLAVLPAGRWSEQVLAALSQGVPGEIFGRLREQYDFVVVDTSPVLPVADALSIGQQVDGVLLSVLCEVSRLNNLYAAWQRLEDLGVTTLGAVVSGVQGSLYGSTYPYPRQAKTQAGTADEGAKG